MYADSIVQARLDTASREFSISPEYHSSAEVDAFEDYLQKQHKYTFDDAGRPNGTQSLTEFDRAWMLNEQILVQCDAAYFLTRYAFVKDEKGVVRRFSFRVAQRLLFDIICELESSGASIEIMILKARQLGMSTLTELLVAHRIIFSYGATAVIGSADQSKTSEMSNMLLLCYDMLPCWLRPTPTSRVESDRGKLMFGQLASGVRFQHGAQKLGIATGSTPTIYHLSEVALYTDHLKLIDEGLWKAVHASPRVLGILESTGRSNQGWWAKTWYYSKAHWPSSRMCPVFLPWFCGVEIYPMEADRRSHPIPLGWRPDRDTRAHVAKSHLYVRSNPLLARHLGADYSMPPDQQWYWEWNHQEAKYKGGEGSFLQEMAGDDEEALQRSIESVFGHETIEVIDRKRKREYLAYGFTGQSIETAHEPPSEDIDYTSPRIPLRMQNSRNEVYRWELIPLAFRTPLSETDPEDAVGKLFVFHPPQEHVRYSIGIDTSQGQGEDSTVISVWGLGMKQQPDFQAAEFASAYVSHTEAYAFAVAIGQYYSRFMSPESTKWPMPYVVVEQVEAVGDTCQLQMMRMGYPVRCFHKMTRYDVSPAAVAKSRRGGTQKLGWFTRGYTRPILTGYFVNCAQNGWAEINSPWLIREMERFEVHETASGKMRLEHEAGQHDDRIFAAAMATFGPHDMDVLAERSKKRMDESVGLPRLDLSPFAGHVVSPRMMRENSPITLDDMIYSSGGKWR